MRKLAGTILHRLVRRLGPERTGEILTWIARHGGVDLLNIAHKNMGILAYETPEISGEAYLISQVLPRHVVTRSPVLLDIGANIGSYAISLRRAFPNAIIHAFEINPQTYSVLSERTAKLGIKSHALGMGGITGRIKVYVPKGDGCSEHGSVFPEVLRDLHHRDNVMEIDCEISTVDSFCDQYALGQIDFMKIDTEGLEYEVLRGASRMIKENRINIIQFEFNEMNVISRVFLRDFYELLKNYDLFRLHGTQLTHEPNYWSRNEIFQFQNWVAIRRGTNNQMSYASPSSSVPVAAMQGAQPELTLAPAS